MIDKPAGLPVDAPRRGGDSIAARLGELNAGSNGRRRRCTGSTPTPAAACCSRGHPRRGRSFSRRSRRARSRNIISRSSPAKWPRRGRRSTCRSPSIRPPKPAGGWSPIRTALRRQRAGGGSPCATGPTLVEFRPLTGRTHQIRVHAREAFGRGIVGDRVYGIPGGPMLLHASRLVVPRDGKATIDVTAPLPDYFGEWADAA